MEKEENNASLYKGKNCSPLRKNMSHIHSCANHYPDKMMEDGGNMESKERTDKGRKHLSWIIKGPISDGDESDILVALLR